MVPIKNWLIMFSPMVFNLNPFHSKLANLGVYEYLIIIATW